MQTFEAKKKKSNIVRQQRPQFAANKSNKNRQGASTLPKSKKIHKLNQNSNKLKINHEDFEEENFDKNDLTNNDDKQYDQLVSKDMKGFNRKKNQYFLESDKYQGRKISHQQEPMEEQAQKQSFQDDEDSQKQEQNQNQIQTALKHLKQKRNQVVRSKLLTESLKQIQKQDMERIKQIKKQKTSVQSYEESIQLKQQLALYNKLVGVRYGMKEEVQKIKVFPKKENCPNSHQLNNHNAELQGQILENIEQLLKMYKSVAQKSFDIFQTQDESNQNMETLVQKIDKQMQIADHSESKSLDCQKLYQLLKQKIMPMNQEVQKQLIKWSQKTSILSSTSSSQYNSLLMQTPIGQTKKIISNWERIASKCQQKRGAFKILFQKDDTIHVMSDPQIFDDYDLFMEIEKHYLDKMENEDQEDFLMNDTLKYLKNRQSNPLHKKQKKDVDRKASKNRKIRYNVHPKLLNFMPCGLDNDNCIQTRDEIVKNMFNCKGMDIQLTNGYSKQNADVQYIDI